LEGGFTPFPCAALNFSVGFSLIGAPFSGISPFSRESRFYGFWACIAGLLLAVVGISGFVYCRILPDGTSGNPFLLLGLAACGLLLSVGTSKHVGKAIGELPRFWKS
jgi:hypothetical protein